jgi:sulfur carrier protein
MNLTVNGQPHSMPPGSSLSALLSELGLAERPVVIELNRQALLPREVPAILLHEGDLIEIIQITAGG